MKITASTNYKKLNSHFSLVLLIFIFLLFSIFSNTLKNSPSKFSQLTEIEKTEFIEAIKNGNCEYKGIPLWGKVQFVDAFEDFTIKYVEAFEDLRVQFVSSFPSDCGKWQTVNAFPDFKVKVVKAFEDIKVKKVEHFPGIN